MRNPFRLFTFIATFIATFCAGIALPASAW
jgi:hypothetical protein